MNYNKIPLDERKALLAAYTAHGRQARNLIHTFFMNGNHRLLSDSVDYSALQRFRNSEHGELHKVSWKALAASMPTGQKTISFDELRRLSFCNSPKLPSPVVVNGQVKMWVGIGWIDLGREPEPTDTLVTA